MILTKFLKMAMLHVVFFLEIGHIGNQKIENFMLISKMQTYLSDKMLPKKVIIEKTKINGTWQN